MNSLHIILLLNHVIGSEQSELLCQYIIRLYATRVNSLLFTIHSIQIFQDAV